MAYSEIEGLDFDAFYSEDDFGVSVRFGGDDIFGLFNNEELDTEKISGVYATFRCRVRIDEGSVFEIRGDQYEVEDILDLEFGEFLHALTLQKNDA